MQTPLRQAINMNKPDMVKALIDAGADPFESMVKNGPPPLTSAMFENKRDALQGMLSFPEVQKTLSYEFANRHNKGVRPVFVSLEMGYLDTARQIFDMGLPVNCVDEKGNTPLHWAIYHKDADFVQYLVEKGADIKGVYNKSGLTPFHLLCTKAHEFKQDDLQRIFDLLTAYGGEILEETKSHKSLNKIIGSSKNERFKNSVKDYQSGFPKN